MAYSDDLREKAVKFYEAGDVSLQEVGERLDVNRDSVHDWVKRKRSTGSVSADYSKCGRKSKLDAEAIKLLLGWVGDNNDFTERELAKMLLDHTGIVVDRSTIGYQLRKRGITFKKRHSGPKNATQKKKRQSKSSLPSEPST